MAGPNMMRFAFRIGKDHREGSAIHQWGSVMQSMRPQAQSSVTRLKVVIGVLCVVVVALASGLAMVSVNNHNPSLKVVSWYYRSPQSSYYGLRTDVICTVNVTNDGGSVGTGVIRCEVQTGTLGNLTYNATQSVSLSPHEQGIYTLTIEFYNWARVTAVTCMLTRS